MRRAATRARHSDAVFLPGNVLNTNDLFVDSMRLDDFAARVRAPVFVARDGLATLFADASLA